MTKAAEIKPTCVSASKSKMPFFDKGNSSAFSQTNEVEAPFFTQQQATLGIQAKLTVGEPNDKYEQEADAVADKVVQKLSEPDTVQKKPSQPATAVTHTVQPTCNKCEKEEIQKKEDDKKEETPLEIQSKPIADALPEPPPPVDDDNNTKPESGSLKCGTCAPKLIQPVLQLKPIFESNAEPILQRRCRECEEGDKLFLKPVDIVQLVTDTPKSDGSRESVVAAAKTMLGKIEAKHDDGSGKRVGAKDLLEIFHVAAPGVWDDSIIEKAGVAMPSWCGVFSVWAHKKAGKNIGTWQMGKGVSAFGTLQQTQNPLPGDIGYIDQPYQHHCIVVHVEGDTVHSIDGNSGLFSEVKENARPRSKFSGFFTAFGAGSTVQKKEETAIQKKESNNTNTSTASIESRLSSSKGNGSSLPAHVQQNMGTAIGADFSNVKIHTDSNAVQMSKDLNAQAFAHGSDVYFNSGKYDTESKGGQHLLAHELTHTVQQGGADTPVVSTASQEKIQRVPAAAGGIIPTTDKQLFYERYKDDVIDIKGKSIFDPGSNLGNYIASHWEEGASDVAVNIKFGGMAEGYIFVKQTGAYINKSCIGLGIVEICKDVAPETHNYRSDLHVLPFKHEAFKDNIGGSLVLTVQIAGGIINCQLGWVSGKQPGEIDPVMDAASVQTDEASFLQLIYGDDYDGENFTTKLYKNSWLDGSILFNSAGVLELANQQKIGGIFIIQNEQYQFLGTLMGQPKGLEGFEIPVERDTEGLLTAETTELKLDANWTDGKTDGEDGKFAIAGELRASYQNGQFDIFGKATYNSARINGEVNISVSPESKAMQLFLEHAPGTKTGAAGTAPTVEENTQEPLALTAWGSLSFKLVDESKAGAGAPGSPPAKKGALADLEGKASFVVSPDGYIILAGKVKFPVNWLLTDPLDYSSKDPENPSKHLFEKKDIEIGGIWVPELLSKVNFTFGIELDASAHLDPLELYEIEIGGVYSNHPAYRSEVDITPRLYIKGNAEATLKISLDGCLDALGLIPIGGVGATLTGVAKAAAFIDAAPTVRTIWEGGDKPATYALEGVIHTGGKVDFALSGGIHLTLVKKKIAKTKDYKIGSWTLAEFGAILKMHEYIIGSGAKPEFDYSKMGLTDKQRAKLGNDIARDKQSAMGEKDKRTGGFQETDEDGKTKEKGVFSDKPIARTDHDADVLDNNIEEDFLMLGELHELILSITGTRKLPVAHIEMASGKKEPLNDKIDREKDKLDVQNLFADDAETKQIEVQKGDLEEIKNEAAKIEKNAIDTAQKTTADEEPKVAGFNQLDDDISKYGKKYNTTDIGNASGTTPKTPAPVTPTVPIALTPGETITIPFKGGKARATFIEADATFVKIKIKSKSASGDITESMQRSVFEGWLADGKVIRWSQERERLMRSRPPYRDGLIEEVWNRAVAASPDGIVRDPNIKKVLTWDKTKNRFDQWHMGHIKGAKYSDLVDTYIDGKITYDEFIIEYNNVKNYRPEDPVENMKHIWE